MQSFDGFKVATREKKKRVTCRLARHCLHFLFLISSLDSCKYFIFLQFQLVFIGRPLQTIDTTIISNHEAPLKLSVNQVWVHVCPQVAQHQSRNMRWSTTLNGTQHSVPKKTFLENASGEPSLLSPQTMCKQNVSFSTDGFCQGFCWNIWQYSNVHKYSRNFFFSLFQMCVWQVCRVCCWNFYCLGGEVRGCGWHTWYLSQISQIRYVEKNLSCGLHTLWRNFKFIYMTDVEKSEISPHVE